MLVTIYTDASYHPPSGKAAGAAWIRSEEGLVKLRRRFSAENSTHAEGIMIYLAMEKAVKKWENATVLFVNTDSLAMCQFLWPFLKTEPKSEELTKVVDAINDLCEKHGVEHRLKHVKGHQSNDDIRAWLNNWCDREASRARKQ